MAGGEGAGGCAPSAGKKEGEVAKEGSRRRKTPPDDSRKSHRRSNRQAVIRDVPGGGDVRLCRGSGASRSASGAEKAIRSAESRSGGGDDSLPRHLPVMPDEVMAALAPRSGETAVDGTVGLGGHALRLGLVLGGAGRLICFDRDRQALELVGQRLAALPCRAYFLNLPFESMDRELKRLGCPRADRIMLDLGVSSLQLDSPGRGFSFMRDGPLDMRMDADGGISARDVVNSWPEKELERLFMALGEEPRSRRLAKSIVERRAVRPIETTGELAELAVSAASGRGGIHPATKMFQAIRMRVNDELGALSRGLAAAGRSLSPGGRLAVLTFHSLEDRLVKRTFLRWRETGLAKLVVSGVVRPGRKELGDNPRARSAKLRAVERLA